MNAEYLLNAVGLLDDELIREAEIYAVPRRRVNYSRWMALAASFAVVIALGYLLRNGIGMGGGTAPGSEASGGAAGEPSCSGGMEAPPPEGADPGSVSQGVTTPGSTNSSGGAGPDASAMPGDPAAPGDPVPAIMVDGVVYWTTGIPVPGEVDESTIRTVTSYTDALPEEDGQTNFDRGLTTRYAITSEGLVVLIDQEWILFDSVPPWER